MHRYYWMHTLMSYLQPEQRNNRNRARDRAQDRSRSSSMESQCTVLAGRKIISIFNRQETWTLKETVSTLGHFKTKNKSELSTKSKDVYFSVLREGKKLLMGNLTYVQSRKRTKVLHELKKWPSHVLDKLSNCHICKHENFQVSSTGFEPMTSAITVHRLFNSSLNRSSQTFVSLNILDLDLSLVYKTCSGFINEHVTPIKKTQKLKSRKSTQNSRKAITLL